MRTCIDCGRRTMAPTRCSVCRNAKKSVDAKIYYRSRTVPKIKANRITERQARRAERNP